MGSIIGKYLFYFSDDFSDDDESDDGYPERPIPLQVMYQDWEGRWHYKDDY